VAVRFRNGCGDLLDAVSVVAEMLSPACEANLFNGRDALPRVRDGDPNTDAAHPVPTGFSSQIVSTTEGR
jgi:hypothetical protein